MQRSIVATTIALALVLSLDACNPYDPVQNAVGGGLYGAAMGAAIGAAATGGPGAPLGAAAGAAAGVLLGAATTPPVGYYGYPGYGGYYGNPGYGGYYGNPGYGGYYGNPGSGGYYGNPGYESYHAGYGYRAYPPQTAAAPATTVAPSALGAQDCHTFNGDATIDDSHRPYYGTACRLADGRWHMVP